MPENRDIETIKYYYDFNKKLENIVKMKENITEKSELYYSNYRNDYRIEKVISEFKNKDVMIEKYNYISDTLFQKLVYNSEYEFKYGLSFDYDFKSMLMSVRYRNNKLKNYISKASFIYGYDNEIRMIELYDNEENLKNRIEC
jgi:hypothetical protein